MVDIEIIRHLVSEKGYRITGHASVEAVKDGISPTISVMSSSMVKSLKNTLNGTTQTSKLA